MTLTAAEFDAGVTRIVAQLTRIADVLEVLVAPPQDEPPGECQHPVESRIDFGETDGIPDFHCRDCGFRSSEATG